MPTTTTHWGRRTVSAGPAHSPGVRLETLSPCESPSVIPASDDRASGRRWTTRLASAAARRARWAWNRWSLRANGAEAARDWLLRAAPIGDRESPPLAAARFDPCPGLTGGVLASLVACGERQVAERLTAWLAQVQLSSGAFPDAGLRRESPLGTAHVIRGLLASCRVAHAEAARDRLQAMISRACDYLAEIVERRSTMSKGNDNSSHPWGLSDLALVGPLALCAQEFGDRQWAGAVERVRTECRSIVAGETWQAPLHLLLPGVESLVDLGEHPLARRSLQTASARQRRDGAVTALPGAHWISSTGLAHLATIWYRLNEHERADRALGWLRRRQEKSGGFLGSYGRGACYYPRREVAWTCKWFLDACQQQVAASFATDWKLLPERIDVADGRLQTVQSWCESFRAGARVADVGCGRGRYLAQLTDRFPRLHFTGVDPTAACLAELPAVVERLHGALPNLALKDGACDGAMAIESLEHALLPERAIDELCRIVRPGGRVLIIDKNYAHQPLSSCESWERWFRPEEVSAWLGRFCRDVKCVAIPHARHRAATGLFLCWTATKR